MLTITVDHDNDETRIELERPNRTRQHVVIKTRYPSQVQEVLSNIFHLLDASHIALQKQDDGSVRTVEEW